MINLKELEKREEDIKKVNSTIARLTERMKMLTEQENSICEELKGLGVDPKDPKEITKLAEEIDTLEQRLNEILPADVLSRYAAMSVEEILDQKVIDKINLNQNF